MLEAFDGELYAARGVHVLISNPVILTRQYTFRTSPVDQYTLLLSYILLDVARHAVNAQVSISHLEVVLLQQFDESLTPTLNLDPIAVLVFDIDDDVF